MALTVHRTVIHYHSAASLPQGEAFGISASLRTESGSNVYISLPFKEGGNPSEPKFAMRLTEGVIFLMNNEVASLMNNEK